MSKKIIFLLVFIAILFIAKYFAMDFPISTGKRVGNLTKISKKGKFFFKTWEGTIDEGSGDKLTTNFSVSSEKLGNELYSFEGRQVIIYYEQYFIGFPRDTTYNVVAWKAKDQGGFSGEGQEDAAATLLSKTLFCSMLGALRKNEELYFKVKEFIKEDNLYLYKQYEKCNE